MDKAREIPALIIEQYPDESQASAEARAVLRPSKQGAITCFGLSFLRGTPDTHLDVNALNDELQKQSKAVSKGDLSRLEDMLTVQAHTLDALFNDMVRRAALNRGEYPEAFDRYMRLALKAQSQCARTVETLAEMKNPKPVAFVQQANIAAGPQQVNNGPTPSRARAENANPASKVLEDGDVERLEQGTKGEGFEGDSPLEAVGEIDRAKVRRR